MAFNLDFHKAKYKKEENTMPEDTNTPDLMKFVLDVYDTITNDDYCAEQMVLEIGEMTMRTLRDIASRGIA